VVEQGVTTGRFRFSTGIFRHLGEELNPHPDQGIIELVKNAYDADARNCRVEFHNADRLGGRIRIEDDGDGMELDDIRSGWLVLGESTKSVGQRTRLERIPAGSKGLGRLAALRLGSAASLLTRPRACKRVQHEMRIDWRDYERIHHVDEIELEITTSRRKQGQGPGTRIDIEDLRERFNRPAVKRLARQMILLADPFGDDPHGFKPYLSAPEFDDLEKLVKRRYFEDAEYHLVARTDDEGKAAARLLDWRGETLLSASHEKLSSRDGKAYECPTAEFDLWVFLLRPEHFRSHTTSLTAVREWLGSLGGVHVYYNGLRVNPYGNEGNDWLDMNLSRARSPEERPSTNTAIGRVRVTDTDGDLNQKTDRSGFFENQPFLELRRFAQDTLEWMARERLKDAEKRRKARKERVNQNTKQAQNRVRKTIQTVRDEQVQQHLTKAFTTYERTRDREVQALHEEIQLYRTLSTAGIIAATFAHESAGNPLKVLGMSIRTVETRARKALPDEYPRLLEEPIRRIRRSISSLGVLGSATLRLIDHEKRRIGRVHLHQVLREVLKTFKPFLDGRQICVEADLCRGEPFLRGSEAAAESIFTNLLNNSVVALEFDGTRERRILVVTEIVSETWLLRVLDSGPGIADIDIEEIWLPGQTTRPNGTGLGLTIVRDAAQDLRGSVEAFASSELGGAEIRVLLPILGF
jgi:signal transduction histidine kinase